jgi:hypothetical protein
MRNLFHGAVQSINAQSRCGERHGPVKDDPPSIILADEDYGRSRRQRPQNRQPRQLPGISLDLVLDAVVELPGDGVQRGAQHREYAERKLGHEPVGPEEAGKNRADSRDHGRFVQTITDANPASGLVTQLARFYHNHGATSVQSFLQLQGETLLGVLAVVHLPDHSYIGRMQGSIAACIHHSAGLVSFDDDNSSSRSEVMFHCLDRRAKVRWGRPRGVFKRDSRATQYSPTITCSERGENQFGAQRGVSLVQWRPTRKLSKPGGGYIGHEKLRMWVLSDSIRFFTSNSVSIKINVIRIFVERGN